MRRRGIRVFTQGSGLLVIITAVAIGIAIASYWYSTYNSDLLTRNSISDIDQTARIQTNDISKILENKVNDVRNNLLLISKSNRVQTQSVAAAAPVFSGGQESTKDLTDSYFWIDTDGSLLWANSFSDEAIYKQYSGADRSDRSYYLGPRESHSFHVSNVINSVDGMPRIYFSYPILSEDGTEKFNGVVVASANLPTVGQYLKSQLSSDTQNTIGLMSKDATILYSQDEKLIGLNYHGQEFQSQIPDEIRGDFNAIIDKSLQSSSLGQESFSYQGNSGSITFTPITVDGASVGVLYLVASYTLADEGQYVLDSQRTFTILSIAALAGVAISAAFLVLKWNKGLHSLVTKRTSELENSNQKIEKTLEELRVHDRMQKEFINVAAHELRTPVQPILSMAEIAEMDNSPNSEQRNKDEVTMSREDFEMILRNARRLERLSSDILEVARIESQSLRLHMETLDINEKIQKVVHDLRTQVLKGKGPEIHFQPLDGPILVDCDKTKIFEVISNLLGNAIKFTQNGSITITAKKEEEDAVIQIRDTGSGIDPEIMPRLFTRFATKSIAGTGLGLYISKAIIVAHGGKIWAENNPDGKGATFSFSLKLQNGRKPEEMPATKGKLI